MLRAYEAFLTKKTDGKNSVRDRWMENFLVTGWNNGISAEDKTGASNSSFSNT